MRKTLWGLLIFCLLAGLPPIRKSEKYIDILTNAEKVRIEQLWDIGVLHKDNIDEFYDRFALAPDRETAIEHALDTSFKSTTQRDWKGMTNVFTEGPKLLIKHYKKHGMIKGTWRMIKTVVLVPFRSWHEIFAGNKGLGIDPFGTLCGAATLVILALLVGDWHFDWFYD
ncbi:MAG: hypothetical protein OXM61_18500 [Candidatus Poribacteria bacterium]|nr:hypothetical protein [Candidatus Poribacteria bacterium]